MRFKKIVIEALAPHEDEERNVWSDPGSWRSLKPARIAGCKYACSFLLKHICDATAF